MNLSKNGRKVQRAIGQALMLGLPVAGLMTLSGCDRDETTAAAAREGACEMRPERTMGDVIDPAKVEEAHKRHAQKFSNVRDDNGKQ